MRNFEDYFKIENAIRIYGSFNVLIGGFSFNEETYLHYNAKKENGKNRFDYLLNHTYSVRNNNKKSNPFFREIIESYPNIRLMYSSGIYCPVYDYLQFITKVMNLLVFTNPNEKAKFVKSIRKYDIDEMKNILQLCIKNEINQVNIFINNGFYEQKMMFQFIFGHLNKLGNKIKRKNNNIIGLLKEYKTNLELLVKFVDESFDCFHQAIDYNLLLETFEYDKYNLLIIKGILDTCFKSLESNGYIDKPIHIVQCYINAVERYRLENSDYNPRITIGRKNGREIIYSYEDLKNNFGKYLEQAPDFKPGYIEEIFANEEFPWEILPSGNKINLGNNIKPIPSDDKKPKSSSGKDKQSKQLRVVEGFEYLSSKEPVRIFKGKNVFEGYIGFEYSNGIVIFEKVYDKNKEIAFDNATYAMTTGNFAILSRLTKPEIIQILKKAKRGLWRFYHTENMISWKSKVDTLLEGLDYSQEDYDYAEELIELEKQIKNKK